MVITVNYMDYLKTRSQMIMLWFFQKDIVKNVVKNILTNLVNGVNHA